MPGRPELPPIPQGQSAAAFAGLPLRLHSVARPSAITSKACSRIWELHHSLHCSIIGTCLSTAELRQLLLRLGVHGADAADSHAVHQLGVILAGKPETGGKHLQKLLNRKHRTALNQFAKAKDPVALATLWEDASRRGDIPGAYWAVLTHPAATEQIVKRVFGEVHMLSHLVGAANRADICRLRKLEEDNSALAATIERQQKQLRDGFTSRDETIRRLQEIVAQKIQAEAAEDGANEQAKAASDALADREKRLREEVARRERGERQLGTLAAEHDEMTRRLQTAEQELEALRSELTATESQIATLLPTAGEIPARTVDLSGLTILYVGGRAHQIPRLKGFVERANGKFLHHDGGIEHSSALLPGLLSRADAAVFPIDCVSHDAAARIKRACGQMGKFCLPLRTSSITSLLCGIGAIRPGRA